MIKTIANALLFLALSGNPFSAHAAGAVAEASAQTSSPERIGRAAWGPHGADIMDWAAETWYDLEYPETLTGRQLIHPGYVLGERYIEDFGRALNQICGNGSGGLHLVMESTIRLRSRQTHYTASGQRVAGNFYNSNTARDADIRIAVPISVTVGPNGVTHRLGTNFTLGGEVRSRDPMHDHLSREIRRAIQRQPAFTVRPSRAGEMAAATSNPAEFQRGWTNIETC